jgi:hypothetical protein
VVEIRAALDAAAQVNLFTGGILALDIEEDVKTTFLAQQRRPAGAWTASLLFGGRNIRARPSVALWPASRRPQAVFWCAARAALPAPPTPSAR